MRSPQPMTYTVIVPTYNRSDMLRECLGALVSEADTAQILVVDSSPNDESTEVVRHFPGIRYLRNPAGIGHLAASRRLGVEASDAEIVVFVDDDVLVRPGYLPALLTHFQDPDVGGVGGRISNGVAGEADLSPEGVGRVLADTSLVGNFTVDTGHPVEVEHLLGATMAYRMSALDSVGGIRDLFPGTCIREDTDTSMRVKQAGWKLVYEPLALGDHRPARYARGRRFDARYTYYGQRNHLVFVVSVFGLSSPEFRAALRRSWGIGIAGPLRRVFRPSGTDRPRLRQVAGALWHAAAAMTGATSGTIAAVATAIAVR